MISLAFNKIPKGWLFHSLINYCVQTTTPADAEPKWLHICWDVELVNESRTRTVKQSAADPQAALDKAIECIKQQGYPVIKLKE